MPGSISLSIALSIIIPLFVFCSVALIYLHRCMKRELKQNNIVNAQHENIVNAQPLTEMVNSDGDILKIGMRVICRSNEPNELIIGTIEYFWDCDGKFKDDPIPHIKDERTGEIWGIMGVCKPYTKELHNELLPLKPIEQWNYLVHPFAQIKEKYGEYYKTFPERNLFKNISYDEAGNQIGKCRTCGANGVMITEHKCPPQYNF